LMILGMRLLASAVVCNASKMRTVMFFLTLGTKSQSSAVTIFQSSVLILGSKLVRSHTREATLSSQVSFAWMGIIRVDECIEQDVNVELWAARLKPLS